MPKRCPDCGAVNEDSRIYCASCGEPLDAQLRLIKTLETQKKSAPTQEASPAAGSEPASHRKKNNQDDDYVHHKMAKKKKASPLPWIILGIVLVVVGILIVYYAV